MRLQREIQRGSNTSEDSPKSLYEEIVLAPQVAPREISTEGNIAYAPSAFRKKVTVTIIDNSYTQL